MWPPSPPNWLRLCNFYITRQDEAIWLDGFGLKWPMCRDRHPEFSRKSCQIWQNWVSGRSEIWQFGTCQEAGGPGIHLGGSVLMSGPHKPNYFLIWAIWGSVRAYFSLFSIIWGSRWSKKVPRSGHLTVWGARARRAQCPGPCGLV